MKKKPGHAGYVIGQRTRRKVWDYFQNNPFGNQRKCAAAIGISEIAVGRAAKAIRAGWRPEKEGDTE